MKIVITGASSGLGSQFLKQVPEAIPVSLRYNDYDSYQELTKALGQSDAVVIHFGALVDSDDMHKLLEANVCLVQDLLDIVDHAPGQVKVILVSSMSLLDKNTHIKYPSEMSPYTFSKFLMEQVAAKHVNNPPLIVRFSTLFYKDPSRDGLSKMIHTAKTKGRVSVSDCRRDFITLESACNLLLQICDTDLLYNAKSPMNLGSGSHVSMANVAYLLSHEYGTVVENLPPNEDDVCFLFPHPLFFYQVASMEFNMKAEVISYYESLGD